MLKFFFLLFMAGLVLAGIGIKFQDKNTRTLGLGLLIVAFALIFLSLFSSIEVFPK